MADTKSLRFRFHHELEDTYRRFFDEITDAGLSDGEMARLAQTILRSRHEGLKLLVSAEELEEYQSIYGSEESD